MEQVQRAHNQLVFADLTDYPVMAQALDNQWLPAGLAERRQSALAASGPPPEAVAASAAELRRSLVNSGTLVVNRAFLLNNSALYSSYLPTADPAERQAFIRLLDSRALVPYLYTERDPAGEFTWGYDRQVHRAWARLLADEADPGLVRFDWDDERNAELAGRVGNWFSTELSRLRRLEPVNLAKNLGIGLEQARAMREGILKELYFWAGDQDNDQAITRNAVYQRFLGRPGTDPYENLLREGPHVVATKQLVDLLYGLGVPKASGLAALTPPDSPPRSTLQELRAEERPRDDDPEAVALLLRGLLADDLHRAVDGPNSYAGLGLADVVRLRREEEWRAYVDALASFVRGGFEGGRLPSPEEFAAGTREVARRHALMLRAARKTSRSADGFKREIATVLVVESAGIALQVAAGQDFSPLAVAAQMLTAAAGTLTVRLQFRDKAAGLSHSVTLPALRLGSLRKDWATIVQVLGAETVETDRVLVGAGRLADRQA
ncbi:hypothetical protein [Streptomyces sp. NPDC001594]|uniref:hypothetical protein n=1 Tax=Streptomyces sp. NPDC001594 TaxID=3364590 RepID=UPI0036C328E1